MAEISYTDCCALFQITASNATTLQELEDCIDEGVFSNADEGRAAFVITTETETDLVKKLKLLGFKKLTTIPRRYQYEQEPLTMWIKKLYYKKLYDKMVKGQEYDSNHCAWEDDYNSNKGFYEGDYSLFKK